MAINIQEGKMCTNKVKSLNGCFYKFHFLKENLQMYAEPYFSKTVLLKLLNVLKKKETKLGKPSGYI